MKLLLVPAVAMGDGSGGKLADAVGTLYLLLCHEIVGDSRLDVCFFCWPVRMR